MKTIKKYYRLAKPGIVYGNALYATAGFLFASKLDAIDWQLFLAMLMGLSLIIACACVWNNWIDRDIDQYMSRTKSRSLVTGAITGREALFFSLALGIGGVVLLLFTNLLALSLALLGVFLYVGVYTFAKRKTSFATELGSLSGAIPPLVGYVAVTGTIDLGGIILFLIVALWQMPHFLAIALYRKEEYASAGIPIVPVTYGVGHTKIRILLYVLAFASAVYALEYIRQVGIMYLVLMTIACLWWLFLSVQGFFTNDDRAWAKKMFLYSLVVVLFFCAALILHK